MPVAWGELPVDGMKECPLNLYGTFYLACSTPDVLFINLTTDKSASYRSEYNLVPMVGSGHVAPIF